MNLQDLFTLATLTASINRLPTIPGKAGATGLFKEQPISTTNVVIDSLNGKLTLVANTSRNDDPQLVKPAKRKRRSFEVPHLPTTGQILPAQLQGLASFGVDQAAVPQAVIINDQLQKMKNNLEATREWHRIGAMRGQILDADGSVIYDLFEEFGVEQEEIVIPFSTADTDPRKFLLQAKRYAELKSQGLVVTGFKAFVGPDYFDALTGNKQVKAAYANWQAAQDRLGGDMRNGFVYGGVEHIEYNATISGKDYIPADEGIMFPVAQGIFSMFNAPANYNETVNTLGLAMYAKAEERDMGKGWDLEAQANPLAMCEFPETLVKLKVG